MSELKKYIFFSGYGPVTTSNKDNTQFSLGYIYINLYLVHIYRVNKYFIFHERKMKNMKDF